MIKASNSNTVYFSEILSKAEKYASTYQELIGILDKRKITHKLLRSTKDIWCRDYMPIQTAHNQFVQFRYEPSYLKEESHLQSDPRQICEENGIEPIFSNINLDGGNLAWYENKVVLTERIYTENPEFTDKKKLLAEIENLLDAEVIIIPHVKSDMTGHADGHIRFLNEHTLLGNDRTKEYKYWTKAMNKVLAKNDLDYIDVPFFSHYDKKNPNNAIGCYLNYLEVGNLIVLPKFETDPVLDEQVRQMFVKLFPDKVIESINYNKIGNEGGLLNCTTWTTLE